MTMKLTGIIEAVFGGRYIFRGYATISNLVKYSKVNYTYQRPVDTDRIDDIIKYLQKDQFRFFPELLFGLELKDPNAIVNINKQTIPGGVLLEDKIKLVKSKFTFQPILGENPITKVISLDFDENATKLSRIDGNHRLSAIEKVFNSDDELLKQQLGDTIVPFSILIQQKSSESEKFESAIFYTINAKARPLTEEQNLRSLFAPHRFSFEELKNIFNLDIQFNVIKDFLDGLPEGMLEGLGIMFSMNHYSCVFNVAKLCSLYNVNISVSRLMTSFKAVEIDFSDDEELTNCIDNINFICVSVFYHLKGKTLYEKFKQWALANGLHKLKEVQCKFMIDLFEEFQNTRIKVFVAMPYYNDEIVRSTNIIYSRVIKKIHKKYNVDISLPGDIMTYQGETVNIVNDIHNRIKECDICFCDITGNNPNVTYEMGMAKALGKHVVILKEESAEKPKSDYLLDFYATFKKDAHITLEEAIEKNIKAILNKYYSIPIDNE